MFTIDWTLRIGDLMVLIGFAGTVGTVLFKAGVLSSALRNMQLEIVALKDVAKVVADVLTTVAVQKNELQHMRADIDELKHGKGFVS